MHTLSLWKLRTSHYIPQFHFLLLMWKAPFTRNTETEAVCSFARNTTEGILAWDSGWVKWGLKITSKSTSSTKVFSFVYRLNSNFWAFSSNSNSILNHMFHSLIINLAIFVNMINQLSRLNLRELSKLLPSDYFSLKSLANIWAWQIQ